MRIVDDNGHGGIDPGGVHRKGQKESNTNLNVANYLKPMLEEDGHQVLQTNPKNLKLGINERVKMCNQFSADVVISIHHNIVDNQDAKGAEVCYDPKNPMSKLLAECIQAEFSKLNEDRGIKPRPDLGMIRLPKGSINVLTEFAFLTDADIDEIDTYAKQKREAQAIRDGVRAAIKKGLK